MKIKTKVRAGVLNLNPKGGAGGGARGC